MKKHAGQAGRETHEIQPQSLNPPLPGTGPEGRRLPRPGKDQTHPTRHTPKPRAEYFKRSNTAIGDETKPKLPMASGQFQEKIDIFKGK